jgi:hypothetical protein
VALPPAAWQVASAPDNPPKLPSVPPAVEGLTIDPYIVVGTILVLTGNVFVLEGRAGRQAPLHVPHIGGTGSRRINAG